MLKFAHITNPVKVDQSSDLYIAQPITFETMRVAKKFADGKLDVSLYSAQFPEDRDFVPDHFTKTQNLERSVLDMGKFLGNRKLPLLKDILYCLDQVSDADYFIYTNADIAILPFFYLTIAQMIEEGYDAFVINRRTISDNYHRIDEISLMYAEIGGPHIGHDCFIFKKEVFSNFVLGYVCTGVRFVGRVLLWNLIAQSLNFFEFGNLHLTFHIGKNKPWKNPEFAEYDEFNHKEALKVLHILDEQYNFSSVLKDKFPQYLTGIDLSKY